MKKSTTPTTTPTKIPTTTHTKDARKTRTKMPTKAIHDSRPDVKSERVVTASVRAKPSQPTVAAATPAPPKVASKVPKSSRSAATPGRMGGLAAAAKVLTDEGKAMRCGEMMEKIHARGLWKTKGKTPAATINAAMIREIKSKGRASRFKKVGRGMFAATQSAKPR